jgi:uncharacterized membrane protein
MNRILEIILGLQKGFLSKEGDFSLTFNPAWPWQQYVGAGFWNLALFVGAIALLVYVYRREGRSRNVRIGLGAIRGLLLVLVLMLLNRPVFTIELSRIEPSVLPIMIDDSISMRVRDAALKTGADPLTRIEAAIELLSQENQKLLRELGKTHTVQLYRFDSNALPVMPQPTTRASESAATEQDRELNMSLEVKRLEAQGQNTQIAKSIRTVLDDLQGQRIAGVVLLTDGRDTPAVSLATTVSQLTDAGVKIYPVVVGSEAAPTNVSIQSVDAQDSVFKDDYVNVRVSLRGSGFSSNRDVTVQLKNKATGAPMLDPSGQPARQVVSLGNDSPVEAEIFFKPTEVGTLDLVVEAIKQPGEIDDEDNTREIQIAVLEAKINVLYVDGYPRWEYRYIKNEMIRDKTVDISCLLTSADPTFVQEGDRPIRYFPENLEQLIDYDVVLFGDVDPRQFSDAQLQLVNEFVSKRGGGFGLVSGPRWSPQSYRGTPIEPLLPVNISRATTDPDAPITEGFVPRITKEGLYSSFFRFFADRETNQPGVGEVYAEHPTDMGPDGRRAPILAVGRYGAGRTLFSAIDDSWRWRYYTGESVFDTYWIQQIRYLARSKKLGQRRLTINSIKPVYELGEQVRVTVRILDPQLLQQLPDQLRVDVLDGTGRVIRQETLMRQEGQPEVYVMSYLSDQIGKFVVRLNPVAGGLQTLELPVEVAVPKLELSTPQIDRGTLSRIATETHGELVDLKAAADKLPTLIPSAAKVIPMIESQPLWDAPLAMLLFVFLITTEWLVRKVFGML